MLHFIYSYAGCFHSECHYAEYMLNVTLLSFVMLNAECRYADCHYAECLGVFKYSSLVHGQDYSCMMLKFFGARPFRPMPIISSDVL
jgi:hypothetical protein